MLCDGSPVTRAHVIARAIRDVLPSGATSRDMITRIDFRQSYPRHAEQRTWERGAHTLSVQPKVLCGPCNNGWMSALEDKAAPVVASMITREDDIELGERTKKDVAQWALAAAIVRGEVVTGELLPIDRELARSFRRRGLDDLPLFVAAVNVEQQREFSSTGPVASSYMHDLAGGALGHLVIFWLREVVIVVATHDFAFRAHAGLGVLRAAVTPLWPPMYEQRWPPRSSVTDLVLMRALGIRPDEMPRQAMDFSRLGRGRSSIDALLLPNVSGNGPFREVAHEVAARTLAELARDRNLKLDPDQVWPQR
ncbi:hypothetical protein GCM10010932_10200 [Agromyces flavus]|nr:hypothetical protein GCM10010932_10200 [Agromyces flavus]